MTIWSFMGLFVCLVVAFSAGDYSGWWNKYTKTAITLLQLLGPFVWIFSIIMYIDWLREQKK
jgi:hypothetical protein